MSDDISEPEKHGTPPPLEDVDLNSPEEEEAEKAICTNGDSEEVVVNGFTSTETSESEDLSEANDLKKNLTALLNDKSASPAKSNVSSDVEVTDELLSEVDAELQEANGSEEFETLKRELEEERGQCERLRAQAAELDARMIVLRQENKGYVDRLQHQADDHIHSAQVKELEQTIVQLQRECKDSQEKLVSHDAAAKRAIASLQTELKQRLDNAQRMLDEARREKESMVMKYALAEQKNIEAADRVHKMEAHVREVNKEREQMLGHCRQMKADKTKAVDAYESKLAEVAALRRDIDKLKDAVETQEVKTKWAQNKLKAEVEMHKETKAKVDELQRRVIQSKEESEQIRQDCQAMIRTYQESEEIKSNSLDLQLKAKLTELETEQREKKDQHQVYSALESQLDSLRAQHREAMRELKAYKDKTQCLDADRICQEQTLEQCRSTIQAQKSQIKDMETSLTTLRDVQQRLTEEREKATNLSQRLNELEHTNKELSVDIDSCGKREKEHLEFTEKISNKNAHLQSENTALQAKLDAVCAELEKNLTLNDNLTDEKTSLEEQLSAEKKCRSEETTKLTQQLEQKTKIADELSVQVEDEKDSLRTLKRRQQANIKDLTRQLQQAKKRLETLEPRGGGSTGDRDSVSMGSMGSRASSTGSLDRAGQAAQASREGSQEPSPQEDCPPIVEYVEVDKQMLLEKIVRLQRTHARKSEKIEFMEDHINQLLNEVQKKAKIIQHYALGLEPGQMTSELMDKNKMVLSKKGGIMASLYSQHSQDGSMNLDLSLQINRKLQAVLEDTLLKNITLKDNLDTLGQEIARLSQENRKIQLKLQALQPSSKR